jgi:hypothetical protein
MIKFKDYIKEQDKWIKGAIKKPGSLRALLGVKEDEKVSDVPDSKIVEIIKKDKSGKVEGKLIAYANFPSTDASEKERILKIVKKEEPKA